MTIRVIRAGEHVQHIPGWGMTVRESGVAVAAAASWWNVGTPVAAYLAKGAASYAASKTDLSGNGNDAVDGVAFGWSAAEGWISTNDNPGKYVVTDIVPDAAYTIAFQTGAYQSGVNARCSGVRTDANAWFYLECGDAGLWVVHGSTGHYLPQVGGYFSTAHNTILSGGKVYTDGALAGTLTSWSGTNTGAIYIGNVNPVGWAIGLYYRAVYIGSATLTDEQAATLAAAMSLL